MNRTITVKCDPKVANVIEKQVVADVVDGFAIHPSLDYTDAYAVTHVKSGLACGVYYDSKTEAARYRTLFRKLTVGTVRLADMDACEALSLWPILLEQYMALTKRELTDWHMRHGMETRNYVANVLDCQMEATR